MITRKIRTFQILCFSVVICVDLTFVVVPAYLVANRFEDHNPFKQFSDPNEFNSGAELVVRFCLLLGSLLGACIVWCIVFCYLHALVILVQARILSKLLTKQEMQLFFAGRSWSKMYLSGALIERGLSKLIKAGGESS